MIPPAANPAAQPFFNMTRTHRAPFLNKSFTQLMLPLLLCGQLATAAFASTQSIVHEGFESFAEGELNDLRLTHDGRLQPAPAITVHARLDYPVVWAAIAEADGSLLVSAGNPSRIIRIAPDGQSTELLTIEDKIIYTLARDHLDRLLLATSPNGQIYLLDLDNLSLEPFFDPAEGFIWQLLARPGGGLFVATGNPAQLYHLPADWERGAPPEIWLKPEDTHLTKLALDADGRLLAASANEGLLYRITAPDQVDVLFDAPEQEIKTIHPAPSGDILFTALRDRSSPNTFNSSAPGDPTMLAPITITAEGPSEGSGSLSGNNNNNPGSQSTIYRRRPDGFVERLFETRRGGVHSAFPMPSGSWLLGSGGMGLLYEMDDFTNWSLHQRAPGGGQINHLLPHPTDKSRIFMISSNPGTVYLLGNEPSTSGVFRSAVLDGGQPVRWSERPRLTATPQNASFGIEVRTGNTAQPGSTWTKWTALSKDQQADGNAPLNLPARYLQYRIKFPPTAAEGNAPPSELSRIEWFTFAPNVAPVIRRIRILPVGVISEANPPNLPTYDLRGLLNTPHTQFAEAQPRSDKLRPLRESGLRTVLWEAEDPNRDQLRHRLAIRPVSAPSWVPLEDDLNEPIATFNTRGFPDGWYQLRVESSDRPARSETDARSASAVSPHFLIDNSPPDLRLIPPPDKSAPWLLEASDPHGRIVSATLRIDGKTPQPLFPQNRFFDRQTLLFELPPASLHNSTALLFTVTDENGNQATLAIDTPDKP